MDLSKLLLVLSIAMFGARITQADVDAADSAGATTTAYVALFGNDIPNPQPAPKPAGEEGVPVTIRPAIYLSPLADGVTDSLEVTPTSDETCGPGGCGPSAGLQLAGLPMSGTRGPG